ncbi:hypothetical protein Lal_00042313 [Lupinus albus]|nr:hypothetical protein Lal_00042313 [Lupinus albus]
MEDKENSNKNLRGPDRLDDPPIGNAMPCSMLTHLSDIVTIGSRRHKLPPLSISLDPFIGIGFRTGANSLQAIQKTSLKYHLASRRARSCPCPQSSSPNESRISVAVEGYLWILPKERKLCCELLIPGNLWEELPLLEKCSRHVAILGKLSIEQAIGGTLLLPAITSLPPASHFECFRLLVVNPVMWIQPGLLIKTIPSLPLRSITLPNKGFSKELNGHKSSESNRRELIPSLEPIDRRQDPSRNPAAGYFIPISPPEGEVDFPILKDKIRSLALPTSPTSVASLVAGAYGIRILTLWSLHLAFMPDLLLFIPRLFFSMLCPLVPLILSLSKSMVELEPGKVLHDRRERLFGPLVVIVLHPRFKALLIEGMETATFRMREAWTNAMVSKRHLFALSNPITAYSAYTFFAESPCLWLSSTFSAIFRHPLDRLSLKQRANASYSSKP